MDEKDKSKKGFLSGLWKVVTSPFFTIPVGLMLGIVIMPLVADMGTWWNVFHNTENLRAMAFRDFMEPLTGWIPYHMGLTEPGGLFYDTMTTLLGSNLETLTAQADAAGAADAALGQSTYPTINTPPPTGNIPLPGFEDQCELLANCG